MKCSAEVLLEHSSAMDAVPISTPLAHSLVNRSQTSVVRVCPSSRSTRSCSAEQRCRSQSNPVTGSSAQSLRMMFRYRLNKRRWYQRGGTKQVTNVFGSRSKALQNQQAPSSETSNTATTPRSLPSLSFSLSHSLSFSPHISTLQKNGRLVSPSSYKNYCIFCHSLTNISLTWNLKSIFESVRVFMKTRIDLKLSFDF